jgi:hypothetical protein
MFKSIGAAAAVFVASHAALAGPTPSAMQFDLVPNAQFLGCLSPGVPSARVDVRRGNLNDTLILRVSGLKPKLQFDMFTVQRSPLDANGKPVANFKGFGMAWYQSDIEADENGEAKVQIKTILLDQIFGFDADPVPGSNPPKTVLQPTNTFHLGFWFNNPKDAVPCGFDIKKPTPFNGEHHAGPLAMISLPVAPNNLGPLCSSPTGDAAAADSGVDPQDPTKFACNP